MYNYWFKRKAHRLKNHNYSSVNSYFITICLKNRSDFLGDNIHKSMILNDYGEIVKSIWLEIPSHYKNIRLDKLIVMSDHLHAIIHILQSSKLIEGIGRKYQLLPVIISTFKAAVTRKINILGGDKHFQWQKSYYDHIIKDEEELKKIQQYIELNPLIHSRRKKTP